MPPMVDAPAGKLLSWWRSGSGRAGFLCLAACVSLSPVSIAAAQVFLALAIALFLRERLRGRAAGRAPGAAVRPLLCFILWTAAAVLLACDPRRALGEFKKFFLYLLVPVVPALAAAPGARVWTYRAVFGAAGLSAVAGLVQFAADPHRDALHRISGFLSHWMTFSGTLMLAFVGLVAYVLCYGWRRSRWAAPPALVLAAALFLSQTRSALLLGIPAGLVAVLWLTRHFKAVGALALLLAAAYLLSPAAIQRRLAGALDVNHPDTRNRIELFETGARLVRDHPWFGVGPKNVAVEALRYRGSRDYPDWMYQHMHNNLLQIAAERGIPGMLLWLWWMLQLLWDAWRGHRRARGLEPGEHALEARMASLAAVGGWCAMLAAGLFEYNFGDSEVLILFLFMMSAPYADAPSRRADTTRGAPS